MSDVSVAEWYRGAFVRLRWFETADEARDYVSRQGDEPGVEWVIDG